MTKCTFLGLLGLFWSSGVFAQDTGAVGLGMMSESSQGNWLSGGGVRATLFLDAGTALWGPVHYGFELEGDVKRLAKTVSSLSPSDVTAFFSNDYYANTYTTDFVTHNWAALSYTLWDFDISPRGYISYEWGDKVQILGFGGLNFNWQSLDETITSSPNNPGEMSAPDGTILLPGDSWRHSKSLGNTVTFLVGARVCVGAFYVDYTRFLQSNDQGKYTWDQYNKDRWGAGFDLRF